ncbi:MAG: hypothetical protein EOP06_25080 [Proteobacteria bacterium]|nr:MAG: hypothetical protein EOP06_25080 [Pseudomonadota bacterium]
MQTRKIALTILLSALAFSLAGCVDSGHSQSVASSKAPDYWSGRVGQKCTVLFSNKAGVNTSRQGDLKSVTDSWIVIGDVVETDSVNGKDVDMVRDYCIPTESISYVSFAQPQKKK